MFDGTKGYTAAQGQKKDFDAAEAKEYADEAAMIRDMAYLKPDHKLDLKGMEKVNDIPAYQIEITKPSGEKVNEYYDVKTGYKVKSEQSETSPQGSSTQTTYYMDYKDGAGGLKYPNMIKQSMGPQMMEMKLKSVEVNTGVKDEEFK